MVEFVRNNVVDDCPDDFLKDNYESAIWNIAVDFKHSRNWEETEKVLEFLAVKTDSFKDQVWSIVKKIISDAPYVYRPFLVDYLSWILGKGAKVNDVKTGQTPLDLINEKIKNAGTGTDDVIYKIRDILTEHGAMTYRGLRNKFLKDHTEYEFALHVLANRN